MTLCMRRAEPASDLETMRLPSMISIWRKAFEGHRERSEADFPLFDLILIAAVGDDAAAGQAGHEIRHAVEVGEDSHDDWHRRRVRTLRLPM